MSEPRPDTGAGTPLTGDVEALTEDIASMLHYRASLPKPDRHERTRGGQGPSTCFACTESARQAVEFVKVFALGGYPLDAARSRPATDPAGLDVEPCPFCAADRPGAVGAGCMECRGRGTVGPAFRRNRGLPPLARLSVVDGPGPEERLRDAVIEYLAADAAMPEFVDAQRMEPEEWDRLARRWAAADVALRAALSRPLPENREEPSR